MKQDSKEFWRRFQTGIQVAVGSDVPDKLLGVRDGFLRYFRDGLERPVPVAVIPQPQDEAATPLPLTDSEILGLSQRRARALREAVGGAYDFYVGSESGLLTFEAEGETHRFVRSWTVVLGLGDEAWGSSGSVQLPELLLHGLDEEDLPLAVPGTRRSGGMVSSLTGGLETRRSATALATLHAISTLMYGLIEGRSQRRH